MKRILSVILVVAMLIGVFPVQVNAEGTADISTDDVTIEGANGFGNLLSEDIQSEYIEQSNYSGGYGVTDLTVEGNSALVEYHTLEDAILVVAIYTEDGLQMLASGKEEVSPDFTETTVTIAGTMPEYFHASAFLVDHYDYSPLCEAYDTPMYTKAMQDLLNATVGDFDADRVLNLDDDNTTNFAVYAENTKVLEEHAGFNMVVAVDDETMTYVIENADENITGLQPGEVFVYPYGDNEILIVKVGSITMKGSTATIIGEELKMEEAFSHVKIEAEGDASNAVVDEDSGDEGITYVGMTIEESPETYSLRDRPMAYAFEGSGTKAYGTLNFHVEKEFKPMQDEEWKVKGSLSITPTVYFSYYVSQECQFMDFALEYTIKLSGEVSGSHKGLVGMLPGFVIPIIPGVIDVGCLPELILEFEAKVSLSVEYKAGIQLTYENKKGVTPYIDKGTVTMDLDVEGTVFFGVDLGPTIYVATGALAEIKVSAKAGVELKAEMQGMLFDAIDVMNPNSRPTIHDCEECMALSASAIVEINMKMEFLKFALVSWNLAKWSAPLGSFYWSFDRDEFGEGDCPYIDYRVIVVAKAQDGAVLEGIEISDSTGNVLGSTNKYGMYITYVPKGVYHFCATLQDNEISKRVNVNKPSLVILRSDNDDQSRFGIFGTIDTTTITDYGSVTASGDCGTNVSWALYENGVLLVESDGLGDGIMTVPEESWMEYQDQIQYIAVLDGVTSIPDNAFCNLLNLYEIMIADSVTSMGSAFENCKQLTYVTVPADYNYRVFRGCTGVKKIRYTAGTTGIMQKRDQRPQNGSSINDYTYALEYQSRENLETVIFEDGVTGICDYAFHSCTALKTVELPLLLESIGDYGFYHCSNLLTVDLPYGLTNLGDHSFEGCTQLNDLIIPDTLSAFGDCAFKDCLGITELQISSAVPNIGSDAFHGCTGLTTLVVEDGVTIGGGAFYNCTGLKDVTVPADYNFRAFQNCTGVEKIHYTAGTTGVMQMRDQRPQNGSSINDYTYALEYQSRDSLKSVVFEKGVTSICDYAFDSCSALKYVELPSTLLSAGYRSFYHCSSLPTVNLPHGMTTLGNSSFEGCTALNHISIPATLTAFGECSFKDCTSIQKILVPATVPNIGFAAFSGCTGLTTLVIEDGVSIGGSAFDNCTGLKEVTVPADYLFTAFSGCNSVEKIRYTAGKTGEMIDREVRPQNGSSPIDYMRSMEYGSRETLKTVEFAEGVTKIGDYVFHSCSALENADLPDSLISIGKYGFYQCSSLLTVDLPEGLTTLSDYSFQGCTVLNKITIPETLESFGAWAFKDCTGIENLVIPAMVSSIGSGAFSGCTGIKTLVIEDGVSIGGSAFENCTGLKDVTVPADYLFAAFDGCSAVESIRYTPGKTGEMLTRKDRPTYSEFFLDYTRSLEYDSRATLKTVIFEDGIINIAPYLFYENTALTEWNVPSNLEFIGAYAFYHCYFPEQTAIEFPATLNSIDSGAFTLCNVSEFTFSGDAPEINYSAFHNVTAEMYYPAENDTWTDDKLLNYYGTLTWIPYTEAELDEILIDSGNTVVNEAVNSAVQNPAESVESIPEVMEQITEPTLPEMIPETTDIAETAPEETVSETVNTEPLTVETMPLDVEPCRIEELSAVETTYRIIPLSRKVAVEERLIESSVSGTACAPVTKGVIGGTYYEELIGESTCIQVASFNNLVPMEQYVLLVLKDLEDQDPLNPNNLLFIDQAAADEDGTLEFRYLLSDNMEVTYVTACGASNQSIADAVITIPEMTATGELLTVNPVVKYNGKTLIEEQDYILMGDYMATKPGDYSFCIRGIYNYSGFLECKYTISAAFGDLNRDGLVTETDAQYLIWHTLFPAIYPLEKEKADFDKNGTVTDLDALNLLWHALFPERHPK